MKIQTSINYSNQKGAALVTSLIFLVIMTMLALSSMNMNLMDEKMASNTQQQNRLFQAAETGLVTLLDNITGGDIFNAPTEYPASATLQDLENNWNKDEDVDEADINIYYDTIKTIATATGDNYVAAARSATATDQEKADVVIFEMSSIAVNVSNESRRTIVSGAWKLIPKQ